MEVVVAEGRLARIVAERAMSFFASVDAEGAAFGQLLDSLELFVPQVLSLSFAEWEKESIDGFVDVRSRREEPSAFGLAGNAILISGQTLSPFYFTLHFSQNATLGSLCIRLGQLGPADAPVIGPKWIAGTKARGASGSWPLSPDDSWAYRARCVFPTGDPDVAAAERGA